MSQEKLKQAATGSNYTYKGNIYTVVEFCKIKIGDKWEEGVIYEANNERPGSLPMSVYWMISWPNLN